MTLFENESPCKHYQHKKRIEIILGWPSPPTHRWAPINMQWPLKVTAENKIFWAVTLRKTRQQKVPALTSSSGIFNSSLICNFVPPTKSIRYVLFFMVQLFHVFPWQQKLPSIPPNIELKQTMNQVTRRGPQEVWNSIGLRLGLLIARLIKKILSKVVTRGRSS